MSRNSSYKTLFVAKWRKIRGNAVLLVLKKNPFAFIIIYYKTLSGCDYERVQTQKF